MLSRKGLVALCAVGSLTVAGCGSSDSSKSADAGSGSSKTTAGSSGSGVGAMQSEVDALKKRPTKIGITEPIGKPIPKGKSIVYLACGVPACQIFDSSMKQAAQALGWNFKTINYGLTPESVKAGWQQVVREKPDGIIETGGFPTSIYKQELAQVRATKTPVVSISQPEKSAPGLINTDGEDRYTLLGKLLADYIIADTKSKAKVLYVNSSSFPVLNIGLKSFQGEMSAKCPSCTTKVYDAPATSIGKDLAQRATQQAQKNRDINYIVAGYNDMALGLPEALKGAGIDVPGKVKVITQGNSPAASQAIKRGDIAAEFTLPNGEISWQAFDILARSFVGKPVDPATGINSYTKWFVTKDTLPSTTQDFPNVADYQQQFKALWGVK